MSGGSKLWPGPWRTNIKRAAISITCNAADGAIFMSGLIQKPRRSIALRLIAVRLQERGGRHRSMEDRRDQPSMIARHGTRRATTDRRDSRAMIQRTVTCVGTRHHEVTRESFTAARVC